MNAPCFFEEVINRQQNLWAITKITTYSSGDLFRFLPGAHRRVSRLPAAAAAGSQDTSSKPPRFFRRRRRFGAFLVGEGFLTDRTHAGDLRQWRTQCGACGVQGRDGRRQAGCRRCVSGHHAGEGHRLRPRRGQQEGALRP